MNTKLGRDNTGHSLYTYRWLCKSGNVSTYDYNLEYLRLNLFQPELNRIKLALLKT